MNDYHDGNPLLNTTRFENYYYVCKMSLGYMKTIGSDKF